MNDISSAVAVALGKMIDEGRIEKMISAHLEKTIDDILKEQLKSWSDFGKMVSEAVKQSLTFEPGRQLTLPSYNAIVADIVCQHLEGKMRKEAADHLKKMMQEILSDPPSQIKLSELVETLKEHVKDSYDGEKYDGITCIVERTEYGSCWVSLGKGRRLDKYKCQYRFLVTVPRDNGPMIVSTIWLDGNEVRRDLFIADRSGFERHLFALWVNKVPFILDKDSVDTEFCDSD